MPPRVIIIGGGVNGLVAACALARAGLAPVVVERSDRVGGCLVTEPRRPDVRVPALSHVAGPLLPEILADTGLADVLQPIGAHAHVCALGEAGDALVVQHDDRVIDVVRGMTTPDSRRMVEFTGVVKRLCAILRPFLVSAPPSVDAPGLGDLMALLTAGRRVRALDRRDAHRLLQWASMPIADLTDEWFESELLKALVSARGIFGRTAGPVSAWTTLELLMQAALSGRVVATSYAVKGGPGAVPAALAAVATSRGAVVRTGAAVARIDVRDGHAVGVTLANGDTIGADIVISTVDPRTTFLRMVDSAWLGPDFVGQVQRIRSQGVVAKVNLVLAGLPDFDALRRAAPDHRGQVLTGHLHIGPTREMLERAHDATKYGRIADPPWLSVAVPSAADASLAPDGVHVMSVYAQGAPADLRDSSWAAERDRLGDVVVELLARHAPGLPQQILDRQVITPDDLEEHYGLAGGHIFHGEHAVDQLFVCRPVYGWARYRTPVEGLFFCGAGAHPGGGVTGACGYAGAAEVLESVRKKNGRGAS